MPPDPSGTLAFCLAAARTNSPLFRAATLQAAAAGYRTAAEDGFFDPQVGAATGWRDGPAQAPEVLLSPVLSSDVVALQGGITLPMRPGYRLGAGAAQRLLQNDDTEEHGTVGQTVIGVRCEVPLARDRGFRQHALRSELAASLQAAAEARQAAVWQRLTREITRAHTLWLLAAADLAEVARATQRAQALLTETQARVELQATAAAQLHPAQLEVALRSEEQRQAAERLQSAATRLAELAGLEAPLPEPPTSAVLHQWAAACASNAPASSPIGTVAPGDRAALRESEALARAADDSVRLARETRRPRVDLSAGLAWQGENEDGLFGDQTITSDNPVGAEIALIWRQPLGFRTEENLLRAAQAEAESAAEEVRQTRRTIGSERAQALSALAAAGDRMALAGQAVEAARAALAAEEARFRLGEGRSRNVLDAQKDLTSAARRVHAVASDLILANADWIYAEGWTATP